MTPPTDYNAWPPAFPAQLASGLLTSLQHVTSSARLFLSGCFQCKFLRVGCWRRQEEQDGAWFDCEKLQVENPYCYANPLAVSEANLTSAPSSRPVPQPAALTLEPLPETESKAATERSSFIVDRPDSLKTDLTDKIPNPASKNEREREGDMEKEAPLRERVGIKETTARYVRRQRGGIPLVESFAAKLEADLRRIEYDRQRAEGEKLECSSRIDANDLIPNKSKNHECHLDDVFLPGISSTFPNEEIQDSTSLQMDVWKSFELEDAFEYYNMAAFYSYGATFPVPEKFTSKTRGEKFEEVFPVSHRSSNNNNNIIIKIYKSESSEECPQQIAADKDEEQVLENEYITYDGGLSHEVSEDELKEFIRVCILSGSVTEANYKCALYKSDANRKFTNIINFGSKSFNRLLVFNLVKSVMTECAAKYPLSQSLLATYPVHLVQRKVLKVMLEEDKVKDNLCGLEIFHSPAFQKHREKQLSRRLVEGVTTSEIKAEDRRWKDFSREEREIKEAIFSEVFNDLICDTTSVFNSLVAKKLAACQKLGN